MTRPFAHHGVDAAADVGVRNSQPEGIGRLVRLGDMVCWNNLGRNVVFADSLLRPRAIFGTTLFADDDEASQYDLDVHAVLDVPDIKGVVVLNHFGTLRGFRRADLGPHDGLRQVEPASMWSFAADVERTVVASGRLVGSRPRSEGAAGVLISAPLDSLPDHGDVPIQRSGERLGEVTALAIVPSADVPLLAVGGEGSVVLAPINGDRLAPPQWKVEIPFRVAALTWRDGALWAAGPEPAGRTDDYDWESLSGGSFAVVDAADGALLVSGTLPDDVAWGTGGVAVVPFGRHLAAIGRTGVLHLLDPACSASYVPTKPLATTSLGIAHAEVVGRYVLCGFNRGGYRLHRYGSADADGSEPRP